MPRGKRVEIVKITVDGVEVDAKACTKCGEVKALTEFVADKSSSTGRGSRCLSCHKRYRKDIRKRVNTSGERRKCTRWTTDIFRDYVCEVTDGEYMCMSEYKNKYTHVQMRHNICKHTWSVTPGNFIHHGSRCPKCVRDKQGARKSKNHAEFICEVEKAVGDEYTALGQYTTSKGRVLMRHNTCGNEWSVRADNFIHGGRRCPKCAVSATRKTQKEFIVQIDSIVGDEYCVLGQYINCRTHVLMRHNHCGHEWEVNPDNFIYSGTRCPACSASKGETRIAVYLEAHGYTFAREKRLEDCHHIRPLPFDFAVTIAGQTVLIEYDGEQHTRPVSFGRDEAETLREFRRIQRNDRIKTDYCRANGIPLIRIDYTQYDEIEEILTRELTKLGVISSETGNRSIEPPVTDSPAA